jgi:hypothetical protein
MAPTNAHHAFPTTTQSTIFFNGTNEIMTARGMIAALSPEERTQRDLIQTHARNQQIAGQFPTKLADAKQHGI